MSNKKYSFSWINKNEPEISNESITYPWILENTNGMKWHGRFVFYNKTLVVQIYCDEENKNQIPRRGRTLLLERFIRLTKTNLYNLYVRNFKL